jgi:hypothetical protein
MTDAEPTPTDAEPTPTDAEPTPTDRSPGKTGRQQSSILPPTSRPSTRLRRWMVLLLIVLASVGILLSAVSLWTHSLLFNTDRWVETVGPVLKDPEVTHDLSVYLTDKAVEAADLEARVADALPPNAQFLAPTISDAATEFVQKRMEERLNQPETYDLWLQINAFAHEHLVAVLEGDSTYIQLSGDEVQLNLVPLVARAMELLQEALPGALDDRVDVPQIDPEATADEMRAQITATTGRTLPEDFGTVTLFKGDQVTQAQDAVRIFKAAVIAILVVTVLLIAAALVFSPRRLRTLIGLGLGTLVAVVVARVAVQRLTDAVLEGVGGGDGYNVASALIESAAGNLLDLLVWLVVAGALVTVMAFLAGKRSWFVSARGYAAAAAGTTGELVASQSPLRQWLGRHYDGARAAGVVTAVVALLFTTSSWWLTILVLALAAVYELAVWRWAEPGGVQGPGQTQTP